MVHKNLQIDNLPTYERELLQDKNIVLCKVIESEETENLTPGFYSLPFWMVKKLQAIGTCYFIEKARISCEGSKNG